MDNPTPSDHGLPDFRTCHDHSSPPLAPLRTHPLDLSKLLRITRLDIEHESVKGTGGKRRYRYSSQSHSSISRGHPPFGL
eukprot:758534-Hanusia_phi.AAC.1